MTDIRNLATRIGIIGLLLLASSSLEAAPGDYDMSFGNGGIATFESSSVEWGRLGYQPDGKLLVAWGDQEATTDHFRLRRHNADGSIDTSFGYQGDAVAVLTPAPQFVTGLPKKVLVLEDGGIIVVGKKRIWEHDGGYSFRAALWRFTASGILDTSFSGDGIKTFSDWSTLLESGGCDVELAASGKFYVAYKNTLPGSIESVVARINPDGGLDATFGGTGKVKRNGFSGCQIVVGPVRTGGSIYWSGKGSSGAGQVIRYHSTGVFDGSYGAFGAATLAGTCFENSASDPSTLELQADGKLVFAGKDDSEIGDPPSPFIARFTSTGSLDPSFHSDGIIGCPKDFSMAPVLKVQSDKKIVMVTTPGWFPPVAWRFRRFLENGQADLFFLPEGPPGIYYDATDLLIQPDGKIVTVAQEWVPTGYRLSRYLP